MTKQVVASVRIMAIVLTAIYWLSLVVWLPGVVSILLVLANETPPPWLGDVYPGVKVSFQIENPSFSLASASPGTDLRPRLVETKGILVVVATRPTTWLTASVLAWMVAGWLAMLYVIYQLRLVVRSVIAGRPFCSANVWRIRIMGVIVLADAVLGPLLDWAAYRGLVREVVPTGIQFTSDVMPDIEAGFFGLTLLALAELFRQGSRSMPAGDTDSFRSEVEP